MRKFFVLSAATLPLTAIVPLGAAQAGERLGGSCRLDGLSFVSTTIGNIAKAPPITIPVNLVCNVDRELERKWIGQQGYSVGYCWHFHNNPPQFKYRQVRLTAVATSPTIYYNFYAQNGLRVSAGGAMNGTTYNVLGFARGGNGTYYIADSISMRFENNQAARLKPGNYQFSSATYFHGGLTAMKPGEMPDPNKPARFCGPYRTSVAGNDIAGNTAVYAPQLTVNPKINISVKTYCNIRKPPEANFGKYAMLKNVKPVEVPVNVDCSAGTRYHVKVNNGSHAAGSQRYMTLNGGSAPNGEKIAYHVGPINFGGVGNGTAAGITETLTFLVPDQPTPPAGIYKDTLIITLERIATPGDVFAATYDGNDPRVHKFN